MKFVTCSFLQRYYKSVGTLCKKHLSRELLLQNPNTLLRQYGRRLHLLRLALSESLPRSLDIHRWSKSTKRISPVLFAEQEANRSDVPSSEYLAGAKVKIISEVPANYKCDNIKLRWPLGDAVSDGVTRSPMAPSLFQHHAYTQRVSTPLQEDNTDRYRAIQARATLAKSTRSVGEEMRKPPSTNWKLRRVSTEAIRHPFRRRRARPSRAPKYDLR